MWILRDKAGRVLSMVSVLSDAAICHKDGKPYDFKETLNVKNGDEVYCVVKTKQFLKVPCVDEKGNYFEESRTTEVKRLCPVTAEEH